MALEARPGSNINTHSGPITGPNRLEADLPHTWATVVQRHPFSAVAGFKKLDPCPSVGQISRLDRMYEAKDTLEYQIKSQQNARVNPSSCGRCGTEYTVALTVFDDPKRTEDHTLYRLGYSEKFYLPEGGTAIRPVEQFVYIPDQALGTDHSSQEIDTNLEQYARMFVGFSTHLSESSPISVARISSMDPTTLRYEADPEFILSPQRAISDLVNGRHGVLARYGINAQPPRSIL